MPTLEDAQELINRLWLTLSETLRLVREKEEKIQAQEQRISDLDKRLGLNSKRLYSR